MSLFLQCVCVGRVCVWLGEGVEGGGGRGVGDCKGDSVLFKCFGYLP